MTRPRTSLENLEPAVLTSSGYRFAGQSPGKSWGVGFQLTRRQFDRLVQENCLYGGESPDPLNGIDRVDNSIGYTQENCVPCCAQCNRAKSNLSKDVFLAWVTRVYLHMNDEGPDCPDCIPDEACGE